MHFIACQEYGVGQIFDLGLLPACDFIDAWVTCFFPAGSGFIDPMAADHWLSSSIFVRDVYATADGTYVWFRIRLNEVNQTKVIYADDEPVFFKYTVEDSDVFFLDDLKPAVIIKSISN